MKSVIEDLWNGQIRPAHNCGSEDPQISELLTFMKRHEETLNKKLGEQERLAFEKYRDCSEEHQYWVSLRAFHDGFCLASRLMVEALLDSI